MNTHTVIKISVPVANTRFFVLALYGLLTGIGLFYHEPWRDETHAWLIAQLSHSLPELIHNIRYEGHPGLWYLLLYGVKQLQSGFGAVQGMHWLLAMGSAYLLLTYAPFPYRVRILLVFSYFLFYEYTIIARNYAVGIDCLFLVCTFFGRRHQVRGHLLLCGLLFILFQTNVYALLIGLLLYGLIVVEQLRFYRTAVKAHWPWYALGMGIVGTGLAVALAAMLPPADIRLPPGSRGGWHHWELTLCVEMIWNAFVPVPRHLPAFRNTNILEVITFIKLRTVLRFGLAVVLVGGVVVPLFRSRLALTGWLLICSGILFVMITQYFGSLRHHGHFALSALVLLWIQPQLADFRGHQSGAIGSWLARRANRWIGVVLVLQAVTGLICYATDLFYPFSASRQVASYLESGTRRHWFRAGYPSDIAEGIAANLPGHLMYYPANGRYGGFLQYDKSAHQLSLRQLTDSLNRANHNPTLLILNQPLAPDSARLLQLLPLENFTCSIQYDETYYLYWYRPHQTSAPPGPFGARLRP